MAWETIIPSRTVKGAKTCFLTIRKDDKVQFSAGYLNTFQLSRKKPFHVRFVFNTDTKHFYVVLTNEKDVKGFRVANSVFGNFSLCERIRKGYSLKKDKNYRLKMADKAVIRDDGSYYMLTVE